MSIISYTTAPTALDADGICAAQQLAGRVGFDES